MKTLSLLALSLTLAVTGCKKKEEAPPTPTAQGSGSATPVAGAGSAAPAAPARDPNADYVSVFARHVEAKPDDPVEVHIDRFKVTKAAFDPKKIEGGTAELELDLTSISSGSAKRDGHLQTPDYLDTAKFATATIKLDNVKKTDDTHFTADADVGLRALTHKYAVKFEVIEVKDDGIRIKAEQPFSRLDFQIGKDSPDPKEAPVQPELVIKLQLTLKKT
jgi:polyisoprenoid-binding protein YceI